jgi:chorismate binding enzyme
MERRDGYETAKGNASNANNADTASNATAIQREGETAKGMSVQLENGAERLIAPNAKRDDVDFCLSVAIRTLALKAKGTDGLRRGQMGVGAGILYESDPDAEYEECRLKTQFLTGMDPGFVSRSRQPCPGFTGTSRSGLGRGSLRRPGRTSRNRDRPGAAPSQRGREAVSARGNRLEC